MAAVTVPTEGGMGQATAAPSVRPRARARARFEQWYPWGSGLVVAATLVLLKPPPQAVYDAMKGSVGSAIDTAAILAGFQGTALGLLLTLLDTEPVNALRRTGHFEKLVKYHWQAILALFLTVGLAIGVQAVQSIWKYDEIGEGNRWIAGVILFAFSGAALSAYRVTSLMVKILLLRSISTINK